MRDRGGILFLFWDWALVLKKRKRYSRKPDGEALALGLGSRHALIILDKNRLQMMKAIFLRQYGFRLFIILYCNGTCFLKAPILLFV